MAWYNNLVNLNIEFYTGYTVTNEPREVWAGTPEREKGQGGQNLLKGTDKILIMILKSISWNLEGQLHSYCAKFLPIIFLA